MRDTQPSLRRRASLVIGLVVILAGSVPNATAAVLPYQDPTLPVATRVADLLSRMTLDEKIGQMTQVERSSLTAQADIATFNLGSLLSGGGSAPATNTATGWANMYDSYQQTALTNRLGIPIIYGVDAVHGHNNVKGATIFPHNIGLGATRNPTLVQQIGQATAEEVAGTGIDWTFAPCLCVARNERWGRTYESFGEDPAIAQSMTTIVTGFQGTTLGGTPTSILATAKHYVGDGGTTGGDDQGNTQLSEADLRRIHLPPFHRCDPEGRGLGDDLLLELERRQDARQCLPDQHRAQGRARVHAGSSSATGPGSTRSTAAAASRRVTSAPSINAGIDMVMVPHDYRGFQSLLRAEVTAGRVTTARIDDAVRRILTKKFQLGLFERPLTDRSFTSTVGSAAHRALARQAVRESLVLLKNDAILPLSKSARIFVAGKNADNIGNQSGGWTISWQGASGATTTGTTILQGIRAAVAPGTVVDFNASGRGAAGHDVAIVGHRREALRRGPGRPNGRDGPGPHRPRCAVDHRSDRGPGGRGPRLGPAARRDQ